MSTDLVVFPDWLACVSEWLRDRDELADIDGFDPERIYTELPATKTFPLVRIGALPDPGITGDAHWAVRATFSFDVWGGPKALTWTIAETIRALLKQRFAGSAWELDAGSIVVGRVTPGGIRRTTETVATAGIESGVETSKPRPRASFDALMVLHPGRTSGS